jgi:hypothetical protein
VQSLEETYLKLKKDSIDILDKIKSLNKRFVLRSAKEFFDTNVTSLKVLNEIKVK